MKGKSIKESHLSIGGETVWGGGTTEFTKQEKAH